MTELTIGDLAAVTGDTGTAIDVLDQLGVFASACDRANLDAIITVTLTAPDGSVVTVTRESAARLRRKV